MGTIDFAPLWITLKTGIVASVFSFFIGIAFAELVINTKGRVRAFWDGLLTLPMVLPPTVAGYILLRIFSTRRPFGSFLSNSMGIQVVHTWLGCVVAATIIALPLMYRNARAAFEQMYDVRSGQGPVTIVRSMSGGNQQKAIIAREIDKDPELLVAVQPTRGLDVGAIEYIHKQLVAQRDKGKAVLLVSLELDEVMDVSDRILVMYEGEIVGELDPKKVTVEELGLYMAGAKRDEVAKKA